MPTANIAVLDKRNFFLFELLNKSVILITSPQLTTYLDPLLNGANNAHAVITGMALEDEITPGILAKASKKVLI